MSLLIYEAPGGAVLLRAQAVIEMTTNRCETTAKSCSGGTHGTRTYDALVASVLQDAS